MPCARLCVLRDLGLPVDVGVQLYLAAIPEAATLFSGIACSTCIASQVDQKKQQFVIEGPGPYGSQRHITR